MSASVNPVLSISNPLAANVSTPEKKHDKVTPFPDHAFTPQVRGEPRAASTEGGQRAAPAGMAE